MPENKQEIKKLVKEELKKKGVEATDEVVEQLSEVAGSDLDGVSGGMNAAGRVALTVGGAVAVAALGAGGMYLGEKVYDKHKGLDKYNTKAVRDYEQKLLDKDVSLYDKDGNVTIERSKAVSYGGSDSFDDKSKRRPLPF